MERSPLFYETVWAAAYAAAHAAGKGAVKASYDANEAVRDLRAEESIAATQIADREELFHDIRAGSAK